MTPRTPQERNEAAWNRAEANPAAVAVAAVMDRSRVLIWRLYKIVEPERGWTEAGPKDGQLPPFMRAIRGGPSHARDFLAFLAHAKDPDNLSDADRAIVTFWSLHALAREALGTNNPSGTSLRPVTEDELPLDLDDQDLFLAIPVNPSPRAICWHLAHLITGDGLSLLALVVENMPLEIDPDRRDTAIMPGSLFDWASGGAPAIIEAPRHDNELPVRPGPVEAAAELYLPGLEPPESAIVPAPALVLAEQAGFNKLAGGSGARIDKRLLVHCLLAVPQSERRPGGRYTFRPTLRELVHDVLWLPPAVTGTGEGTRSGWKPRRHAPLLRRAMNAVTLAGIILPDGREWRPTVIRALPNFYDLDSRADIEMAFPEGATGGPLIRRDTLNALGMVSDPAYDCWLTLSVLWDRAKMANGRHRIYATRPTALRDPQGRLTRADGSLILGHGRKPQHNWRHPEAVIIGEERHPQADKVPPLNRDDRRRLVYGRDSDRLKPSARTMAAKRADALLRTLAADGRVVIEDCGRDGWRILEPYRPKREPS